MNNQPPAGSFESQTRGFAQPRVVNIVTQGIPLCLENRDREEVESPSLCDEKNVRKKIKRKGRAPVSSNDA